MNKGTLIRTINAKRASQNFHPFPHAFQTEMLIINYLRWYKAFSAIANLHLDLVAILG